MEYLNKFLEKIEKEWKGSLVSVRNAGKIDRNAKKFLSQLAAQGKVTRVTWGWYWVPVRRKSVLEFLAKDRNFKVLQKQSAASVWNGDFVHRDIVSVAVQDASFARALRAFAKQQGWGISVETRRLKPGSYKRIDNLYVEALEDTIVDCIKQWAFEDAFAAVQQNRDSLDWNKISKHAWERIRRTNARVSQVLKLGSAMIEGKSEDSTRIRIADFFVRQRVEEAARKVLDLG
ncbi:MAG: hypothetical protein HY644_05170 [Acidobacteria bacterium]|nr:hypothetical protein [Acidobacteriota bacterium]